MTATPIEKANRDLAGLEGQRENLFGRAKRLSDERYRIAFAALTAKDKKAAARLVELNTEDAGIAASIASVEAALTVARSNLKAAEQAAVSAADRERAAQIHALNMEFTEELRDAGAAFADGIASVLNSIDRLARIHERGIAAPIDRLFLLNVVVAIKSSLQLLPAPLINELGFMRLAPNQRKQFQDLADAWGVTIDNQIAAKFGAIKSEAA